MAFPGSIYAPPGTYTRTSFESPVQGLAGSVRIPLYIGTGSEILNQSSLELVRGSSSSVDQRVVQEDLTGRAVESISSSGAVTLGNFNGDLDRVRVRNYPIVTGDGSGTTATNSSAVSVTVNGTPVVVTSIDGARGILQLSVEPRATDTVLVTYYFNRTDTLITDNLSDQVDPREASVRGALGQNFEILEGVNDTLSLTVDGTTTVDVVISPSPTGGWTSSQVAAFINSSATGTSLSATTTTDNFGNTVLLLTADRDLSVGSGTANSTLGITGGSSTNRNRVFYTFQSPIVDGSNGGITTTDPADVTVRVNGVQVIPTSVDGQTGAVTLPFAPAIGDAVLVTYHFNSWQSTFDYLAHRNVLDISQCGLTPDRNDYVEGVDFILKDDLILWGTSYLIESGTHTTGSPLFDSTQVTATLVDVRQYLAPCESVVNTSVNPPVESRKQFRLPLQPTTGNGRNSPLGASTFNQVANGRIDLPTNRPDLVFAYWGFSLSDAFERGRVTVTKVDSDTSTITLAEAVPVGASVYATFYYNTIQDQGYTVQSVTGGPSGVGTYRILNEAGDEFLTPTFGSKSAGLATVTIAFPSGSERLPDVRFETPFDSEYYQSPVEEDVTVTFSAQNATLGAYTVPSAGPYYTVAGSSDRFDVEIDGGAMAPGFVNLTNPTGFGSGVYATLVGDIVSYSSDSGGVTYDIDSTNSAIDLEIDGVLIQAQANQSSTATVQSYAAAINRASFGEFAAAQAGGASSITLAASASDVDSYYVGWEIKVTAGAASGDKRTISAYNGTTKVATVSVAWTGSPSAGNTYHVYDPASVPVVSSATRFLSPVTIAAGEYDELRFHYTGSTTGTSGIAAATLTPGTYANAAALAAEVQTQVNAAIVADWGYGANDEVEVIVSADSSGRLTFALKLDPTDTTGGFLEFIVGSSAPANDFCILAGLDTDSAAQGQQTKLVNGPIARRSTFAATPLAYDRLVLRNRIIPGSTFSASSMDGQPFLDQCELKVLGGNGATFAGLTANELGLASLKGSMLEPTLFGEIGFGGGQSADTGTEGQPLVEFFAAGGSSAQNNVFKLTFEGTPVTITFKDFAGATIASGASAEVPLGPKSVANTVLHQINAALVSAGVSGTVVQEGAGIRFRGSSVSSSSSIRIGTGNANETLGFSSGDESFRTVVEPEVVVSALMAQQGATASTGVLAWGTGGSASYFSGVAVAKTVRDEANAKYLHIQSMGVTSSGAGSASSVTIAAAASASVTRPGSGFGFIAGDGNSGEDAIDGYFVTSSDPVDGSGSANTSVLNSGSGQDGNIGQTYRDLVTGLTFTILPREGGSSYPAGQTLTFQVRRDATSNANVPVSTIPGIELVVSNTLDIPAGDSAVVTTFEKSGAQPAVGDVYYVSYSYRKQDYGTSLYTKLSTISAAYGANGPQNPVTLASYLGILNGAVLIAIKQVQKDQDTDGDGLPDQASTQAFLDALDETDGVLPGGAFPDILVPLKGDSLLLFQQLALHCDVQSGIRYRAERTGIVGLSAGTQPNEVGDSAQAVRATRLRMVYPDIYALSLSQFDGTVESFLVDGTYMAAAIAGGRTRPSIDVATPWTNDRVFGFDSIARTLDAVEQNQVAVRGVTVISQENSVIKIRQGFTTDMSNVLTKTPTVITIADEVQRQSRSALDKFIGNKFLPGVKGQIEAQLSNTLKNLQTAQIIAAYTGVTAAVSPDDPTVAEVEAYYQPVFPLLYIVIQFNLRQSI